MKINKLTLENFRVIENAVLELNGKSTIFFGINGTGKSTVLRAINLLFASIVRSIVQGRYKYNLKFEEQDIMFGKSNSKIEVELKFADGELFEFRRRLKRKTIYLLNKRRDDIINKFIECFLSEESEEGMPIFVSYAVNRLVMDIPLRVQNKHVFDKIAAFEKIVDSKIDFRTFFEWYRYQEDIENETKVQGNLQYEDVALKSVKAAVMRMLGEVSNLRIQRRPLAMKVDKEGKSLNVAQLSDGEKCTLALLGDLTRRLALANPKSDNPLHGEGVVLIDEIELHMHPTWQREILSVLRELFPNVQFIVTTHSPQILGEVGSEYNLMALFKENGKVVTKSFDRMDGRDVNYILEEFMQTTSLRKETKKLVDDMYEMIAVGNLKEANEKVAALAELTDQDNADVIKANMWIKRKSSKL